MKQKGDKWPWAPESFSSLWRHQIFPQDLERGHKQISSEIEGTENAQLTGIPRERQIPRTLRGGLLWFSQEPATRGSHFYISQADGSERIFRTSTCLAEHLFAGVLTHTKKEERLSLASLRKKNPYPAWDRTVSFPMFFWGQQKHEWPSILNFVCSLSPPMRKTLIFFSIWETWTTEIC